MSGLRGDQSVEKLTVFLAKTIRTMDLGRPIANVVAEAEGKVVSVGNLESMKPWLDRHPYEVDDTFPNKVFCPGFIDSHTLLWLSGTCLYRQINSGFFGSFS